jgi:hypothetical protein
VRPGVNIRQREAAPPLQLPTDVSIFMVGVTEKGPLEPIVATTPTEWTRKCGTRTTSAATMADSAEFLFKANAKRIITSRVVGPGAVVASVAVLDSGAATVFTVKALGPGAYGNDLNLVVRTNTQDATIPVGSFVLRVQTDGAVILEESPVLADKQAAVFWIDTVSQYLDYTDGASANDPAAGTLALVGGNDDVAGITDTQWQDAIDRFSGDLGTGILITPGRTTTTSYNQVGTKTENGNLVGFIDMPDTPTTATVTAAAASRRGRFLGAFWPWVRVAGVTAGSYRVIPPSVAAAGKAAANDALGVSPNRPAAGELGILDFALGVTQTVTDAQHEILNNAGVNVIRRRFNQTRIMGWRTTSSESADPKWVNLGNARLNRYISNASWLVGERFLFREIDGLGRVVAEWGAALAGEVMMPLFLARSLYGETPEDSFRVDLSENTDTTAQNRQLLADIIYVDSQFGEEITVSISKNLITEGVS